MWGCEVVRLGMYKCKCFTFWLRRTVTFGSSISAIICAVMPMEGVLELVAVFGVLGVLGSIGFSGSVGFLGLVRFLGY